MRRAAVASMLAALVAGSAGAADERSAAVRVRLRISDDAVPGTSDSVRDIQEALRAKETAEHIVEAPPEAEPDLILVVAHRFSGAAGGGRRGDLGGAGLSYSVRAILVDAGKPRTLDGRGIVWREAATQVVRQAAEYAREQQAVLLRRRQDWPDVGFEFEPLTKDYEEALGAKGGPVIVTAVAAEGPGARAGLRAGDAIAKAAGRKLRNAGELARALYEAAPRAAVPLEITRGGERHTLTLTRP